MCENICLFAGTTEGRQLAEILHDSVSLTVCVATEYGEVLLDGIEGINIRMGRMDADEMVCFFSEHHFDRILDATHPYAQAVTENIRSAAAIADISVTRILREIECRIDDAIYVSTVDAARAYLQNKDGNIFLTTGAKELSDYVGLDMEHVWARVLPTNSSLEACVAAGIPSSHIIAAQGPFSEELNTAQLKAIDAKWMVTKASGKKGGFEEKIRAARTVGAVPIIIGQPPQAAGVTIDEALLTISSVYSLSKAKITVIGIGPGNETMLSAEASHALHECDAVIGAKSVVENLSIDKPVYNEFLPERVCDLLETHPSIRRAALVMHGDVGFYSGAKKLLAALVEYDVTLLPGISSVQFFAAKLGVSWDDALLISLHGREENLIHAVKTGRKIFALTGGENRVETLCRRLCEYGLSDLPVCVGENLSYQNEKITKGNVHELAEKTFDALSVLYIENPHAITQMRHGIPDEEFVRGDVPMTKSEVRSISLAKLALTVDSIVYDVGAGSGSISVECALASHNGHVYAIEKEADAVELIKQNQVKFGCENLHVIEGIAPSALETLPVPTHVFIGGSSGNLRDIIAALLEKNPSVRIVINTVTVETQTEVAECAQYFDFTEYEVVTVNIARSRKLGRYHMMTAQNPVSVITLQGGRLHG